MLLEVKMNTALKIIHPDNSGHGKNYINRYNSGMPKEGVLFVDFIRQTAAKKAKRMSQSYLKSYNTIIYHINRFSELNDAVIFTNSVNEDFLDDFIIYLENCELKANYIKNIIGLVKAMAAKAGSYGFAVDPTYDNVDIDSEDTFNVYLSMNEITRIYYFKGLTFKQQRIRDLFVVGCLTALRYSDYSTLTRDNFQGNAIVKITKKTGKKVIIPVHDYVREIYNKYEGEISSGLSVQHFNRYIKQICKTIGLDDPITFTCTKGGKQTTETKLKYELISSHTARRSAATNMYLTGRMKTFEIMSITGHTTEKSFFKYIKISTDDISNHLATDYFFKK